MAGKSAQLFGDVVEMLVEVTGENDRWADGITPNAVLDADLLMESIEVIALGERIRERYGEHVDLTAFVAGLDIDAIIGLTVGDVVDFLAAAR